MSPDDITSPEICFQSIRARHFDIVNALVKRLPKAGGVGTSLPTWTQAVKTVMEALANEFSNDENLQQIEFYGTRMSGAPTHEWLIDVVWYHRIYGPEADPKTKTSQAESILLALESEWKQAADEVVNDFIKLLAVKAPIKIMLFERRKAEDVWAALNSIGQKWTQHCPGDVIYAINFHDGKHATRVCDFTDSEETFELKEVTELTGDDEL